MDSPYAKELSLSFTAVRAAAHISRSLLSTRDKRAIEKNDFSPVTIADFAVQALLVATIKAAFPADSFVGEEDGSALRENGALLDRVWDLLQRVRDHGIGAAIVLPESKEHMCGLLDLAGSSGPQRRGRTWVFDPIDGTRTYLRGELYAINIALLVDGHQTLGCIGCPNMAAHVTAPLKNDDVDASDGKGFIVYAVRGHGAYTRPMDVPPPPLSDETTDEHARRLPQVSSSSDIRFVTCDSMAESALEGVHPVIASRLDAAYPGCDLLAWVLRWTTLAMGLGNTTVWVYKRRDRHAKVWDHAGAMLLFEETGGKITDVLGRDIDFTVGRIMSANFGFVAAPRHLHSRVLSVVREVLMEQGHAGIVV